MKELVISPEDLAEAESIHTTNTILDEESEKVLNFMKGRKIVTRKLLAVKLNLPIRRARTVTDILIKLNLIEKQYAYVKTEFGTKAKTAIYSVIKNGRKRNSKKV